MQMLNRTCYVTFDPINRAPISNVVDGYTFTLDKPDKNKWIPVSKSIQKLMTKNENNPWLSLIEETGRGFITNLIQNLTLSDIIELISTSRRLNEILTHYIYYNDVTELSTRIINLEEFFKKMPFAKHCNYKGDYTIYSQFLSFVPSTFFEGKNLVSLDLSNRNLEGFDPENFKGIKHLCLNRCTNVTNDMFRCLQGIKSLEFKHVKYPNINAEAFAYIVGIEHLDLAYSNLGCNGQMFDATRELAFSFLQGIKTLNVTNIGINDKCLIYLDGIEKLNISECTEITDIGIEYITRSGCLKELIMVGCAQNTITKATHERLKSIPVLNMDYCSNIFELCPICNFERRIDRIQEHLDTECIKNCTFCNRNYRGEQKDIHLNHYCRMNFFKCNNCYATVLQKNKRRHKHRCSMRMITCTRCSDTTMFAKKDLRTHINMNYEEHTVNMNQFIKSFPFVLIRLDHKNETKKINALELMNSKYHEYINRIYDFEITRQAHHKTLMLHIMSINKNNIMKRLLIQCNMMKEQQRMCYTLKNRLDDIISYETDYYDYDAYD